MPVKVRLENPFLGTNCYVGSNSNPMIWNLTSGTTTPPAGPNTPIGGAGRRSSKFLESGRIIELKDNKLVDNAWSAPGVIGCGGFLVELLLNPIINSAAGLPAGCRGQHGETRKHDQHRDHHRGQQQRHRESVGKACGKKR